MRCSLYACSIHKYASSMQRYTCVLSMIPGILQDVLEVLLIRHTPVARAAFSSATSLLCQLMTSHAVEGCGCHSRSVQLHRLVKFCAVTAAAMHSRAAETLCQKCNAMADLGLLAISLCRT